MTSVLILVWEPLYKFQVWSCEEWSISWNIWWRFDQDDRVNPRLSFFWLFCISCYMSEEKGQILQTDHWILVSPPFLKFLFPLPSFLFHSLLRYFTVPPTHTQPPPALIRPTNLLWFKQISKELFYQFNCRFLSKFNF